MALLHLNKENFHDTVAQDKPVLVDFWAPWCGPCRMLGPILDQLADERPDLTIAKVNVDEEPELAQAYGVMSIPTLIVFRGGEPTNRSTGARPKGQILAMME